MIRAVVFDLDHTLFDRYATFKKVMPELYNHYRNIIPSDMSVDEFIEGITKIEKNYIHYSWNRVLEECTKEGIINLDSEEKIKEAINYIVYNCWSIDAVKYPFTEPMLIKLKEMGYKTGIITNGGHEPQSKKIEMLGIAEFVDEIVITGDVGVHKPEAEPFIVMSQKLGIAPEEMLYVGDHPLNDVEGSRNAGYIPVWVKTTGFWCLKDIEHAPYEVETVAEIPELLEKINK